MHPIIYYHQRYKRNLHLGLNIKMFKFYVLHRAYTKNLNVISAILTTSSIISKIIPYQLGTLY